MLPSFLTSGCSFVALGASRAHFATISGPVELLPKFLTTGCRFLALGATRAHFDANHIGAACKMTGGVANSELNAGRVLAVGALLESSKPSCDARASHIVVFHRYATD